MGSVYRVVQIKGGEEMNALQNYKPCVWVK
jgi:hypothetical protein